MVHTMGCFFVNIYDFSHHYFEVEIADFSNDLMYNFKHNKALMKPEPNNMQYHYLWNDIAR